MKTLLKGRLNHLSKMAPCLACGLLSVGVGWIAGILYVFAIPFIMLAWSVAAIAWGIWVIFTWAVFHASELTVRYEPVLI